MSDRRLRCSRRCRSRSRRRSDRLELCPCSRPRRPRHVPVDARAASVAAGEAYGDGLVRPRSRCIRTRHRPRVAARRDGRRRRCRSLRRSSRSWSCPRRQSRSEPAVVRALGGEGRRLAGFGAAGRDAGAAAVVRAVEGDFDVLVRRSCPRRRTSLLRSPDPCPSRPRPRGWVWTLSILTSKLARCARVCAATSLQVSEYDLLALTGLVRGTYVVGIDSRAARVSAVEADVDVLVRPRPELYDAARSARAQPRSESVGGVLVDLHAEARRRRSSLPATSLQVSEYSRARRSRSRRS